MRSACNRQIITEPEALAEAVDSESEQRHAAGENRRCDRNHAFDDVPADSEVFESKNASEVLWPRVLAVFAHASWQWLSQVWLMLMTFAPS